ncbi:MAG: GAF domain-containing protein [Hyphomicrobiales bacterium]|nr:MAG: GAF domain-containing protein [Hyphomicrobiales bacterium]
MLDTPREQDFDEIAELASRICETPIAVVNLVGNGRQFFKAEVGLGVRETPLDSSFCARAILEQDFMIIPDATKDTRFDCNPLVTAENGLRFYAGALLKTAEGHPIGTVCVLDFKPRNLSDMQQTTLKVLARQVMRQLELRRTLRERDEAQAQQAVLNAEIAHRMKNTLAMVQAIATQTLKGVTERDAVEALARRIAALGSAHDQLLQQDWTAASLEKVVRPMLLLHGDGGRIRASGPDIDLGPKATLSISLLLHELATNAAKYGSLSAPEGKVELSWTIDDTGEEPVLRMHWQESGGPEVNEPSQRGFGSRLIQMGLIGKGGVTKRWLPSGLVAEFEAAMSGVKAL